MKKLPSYAAKIACIFFTGLPLRKIVQNRCFQAADIPRFRPFGDYWNIRPSENGFHVRSSRIASVPVSIQRGTAREFLYQRCSGAIKHV
jgi:hypothetical protein